MELLSKLLDLLNKLFDRFTQQQKEKNEIKQTEIKTNVIIEQKLKAKEKKIVKPPKNDDFFSDGDGW
jgi:hypothetical protein